MGRGPRVVDAVAASDVPLVVLGDFVIPPRDGPPNAAAIEVCLHPGELLVFDNLALAHGRRGPRRPGELNQRIFGHPALPVHQQVELRDRVLAAFAA